MEPTEVSCVYLARDEINDLFNWSGPRWLAVTLHLTDRAYRLLIEEHPAPGPKRLNDHRSLCFATAGRARCGIGGAWGGLCWVCPAKSRSFLRTSSETIYDSGAVNSICDTN